MTTKDQYIPALLKFEELGELFIPYPEDVYHYDFKIHYYKGTTALITAAKAVEIFKLKKGITITEKGIEILFSILGYKKHGEKYLVSFGKELEEGVRTL